MNTENLKTRLRLQMAANLGMDEIKSGSYLHTLSDGLYQAVEQTLGEVTQDMLNLNIDTADEETLEVFGVHLGAPRIKTGRIALHKERKEARLEVELHRKDDSIKLPLYSKGFEVDSQSISLIFAEDIAYDSSMPDSLYVSCVFKSSGDLQLDEGVVVLLPNPKPDLISQVSLVIEKPRTFSPETEDLSSYRKRLLALTASRNISGEALIVEVLRASGVHKHYIAGVGGETRVYCMTNDLYEDVPREMEFRDEVIPALQAKVDSVRPFGSYLKVMAPKPVDIIVNVKTKSEDITTEALRSFLEKMKRGHVLGKPYRIQTDWLKASLDFHKIQAEFEIQTEVLFNGYKEVINDLVLEAHEFPRFLLIDVIK